MGRSAPRVGAHFGTLHSSFSSISLGTLKGKMDKKNKCVQTTARDRRGDEARLPAGPGRERAPSCGRGRFCRATLFELGIFPQQTEAQSLLAVEPHPEGREGSVAIESWARRKQTHG